MVLLEELFPVAMELVEEVAEEPEVPATSNSSLDLLALADTLSRESLRRRQVPGRTTKKAQLKPHEMQTKYAIPCQIAVGRSVR